MLNMLSLSVAYAAEHIVNLAIGYKTVNFAGKTRQAMAVNNQIPAPTLRFKEGDKVTIHVHNRLDKETALHWHGILVPWQMDGVLGINQKGIPPGGVFHYQFTLKQSGTYWYHAHAGLQEQQGLYGAFLIDPPKPSSYRYNKDYTIVLSDWSNTDPDQILANLKKNGDYYSPNFPLQPSLMKFMHDYRKASSEERQNLINDYKAMQKMRMSIYDISDVAYDAFLLNGHPKTSPWTASVTIGDTVRLRFIGAGGNTIFHVKIPGTSMKMVHAEGNDIQPFDVEDFTVAPGETYDVLVSIQKNEPYMIYAESLDTVGTALGALINTPNQIVNYSNVTPFDEPVPVTRQMMSMMMSNKIQGNLPQTMHMQMSHDHAMHGMSHMDSTSHSTDHMKMDKGTPMHENMKMHHIMPTEPSIIGDSISSPSSSYTTSSATKYENMIGAVRTNNPNIPIAGVINMELFGYMDRFIWFINGAPEQKAHPIVLKPGKRYRFVFTNTSMMHHPMHIHGHWFILRKGNDAYDPLLHTIDVPPGATITADIDTDASGQWIFHCHFLYHMMAGMARTFQYSTLIEITKDETKPQNIVKQTAYYNRPIVRVDEARPIDLSLIKHPMAHPHRLWLASYLDVGINPVTNTQKVTFKGLYGSDYHKLELFTNDAEVQEGRIENADVDIFYWHLLNQFWAVKGGVNYFYRPANEAYWQPGIGIEGLMPYFIDTDVRGYIYSGSAKLDIELSRDTQMTNNFFVRLGARSILATKTVTAGAIGSGLNQMQYVIRPYYRIAPGVTIFAEFESDQYYGDFRNIQVNLGNSYEDNTLTFGLSVLF